MIFNVEFNKLTKVILIPDLINTDLNVAIYRYKRFGLGYSKG